MAVEIFPVIMVGGSGTRLWPRSRAGFPKQMMSFGEGGSLLKQAYDRAHGLAAPENVYVVTTALFARLIRRELPDVPSENILSEPEGRDTAAAIALGALAVHKRSPEGVMVVMPADHLIKPVDKFVRTARAAAEFAFERGSLVTTGVLPGHSATAYGYIHRGVLAGRVEAIPVYEVKSFKEKPSKRTAKKYAASGEHYWNSGIFVWRADVILKEIRTHMPKLAEALDAMAPVIGSDDFSAVASRVYPTLEKISVDYGIMEGAKNVAVIESTFDWDDVGSWSAVADHLYMDENGNAVDGDFVGIDVKQCVVIGESNKLVAAIGISGLVVVDTPHALFVCPKSRDQEVKQLVQELREMGREDVL